MRFGQKLLLIGIKRKYVGEKPAVAAITSLEQNKISAWYSEKPPKNTPYDFISLKQGTEQWGHIWQEQGLLNLATVGGAEKQYNWQSIYMLNAENRERNKGIQFTNYKRRELYGSRRLKKSGQLSCQQTKKQQRSYWAF